MPFTPTLVERLARAESVAVLTGAGISAESGVPTFRDPGGLWEQFRPEELANVRAFLRNPNLVQRWYRHRRTVVEAVEPNPGHHALVGLERRTSTFTLVTQNVDGLHERAGSRNLVRLHGTLTRNYCIDCRREAGDADLEALEADADAARCPACGGLIRPDVVWFGEQLPDGAFERAAIAATTADVFLSIGTSAVVYPAADLPMMARGAGAYTAEFNIEPSAIAPRLHETVLGPAGETLPKLLDAVERFTSDD